MRNPFQAAAQTLGAGASGRRAYYRGAANDRFNLDWTYSQLSADWVLRMHLQTLRDRARELVGNDSAASTIPQLFSENVIGKDGITLQSNVRSTRDTPNKAVNDKIEAAWTRWSEDSDNGQFFAAVDRKQAWPELQTLAVENEPTDGEVLIRIIDGFENPFRFALDFLDPDQLDHTLNRNATATSNAIVMGVEIDQWGAPVQYWLWSNHPSESARGERKRVPVPAADIIHLGVQRRPKQTRYVTWFAPVVMDIRMLSGYRLAELMAARAGAAHAGYIHGDPEKGYDPPKDAAGNYLSDVSQDIEPLSLQRLLPGEEITFADPKHPTTAYEAFEKAILRSVASALRVSYMSLTGDMSDTSYSSGRIGMLNERTVYEKLQERFIRKVCRPIYRRWLRMALLSGQLELGGFEAERYDAATWHPRSFPWIDPQKDIDAAGAEVGMGLTSLTRLAKERGRDLEDVFRERQEETQLAEQYGVEIVLPGAKGPAAPGADASGKDGAGGPTRRDDAADDDADDDNTDTAARRGMRVLAGGH